MDNMNFYQKHYIRIREDGCIVDGFSDAFRRPTEEDICINEKGGYQFRLLVTFTDDTGETRTICTEENPCLFEWDCMIPLYKWDGEVLRRSEEEIETEREILSLPTADEVRAQRDKLLAETDWTQVLDAPIDKETLEAYRVYRQALRDVPEQEGFPTAVVWPELPAVGKADPDPVDTAFDVLTGGGEG